MILSCRYRTRLNVYTIEFAQELILLMLDYLLCFESGLFFAIAIAFDLFILSTYHDEIAIFVWNARVACPGWRYRAFVNRDARKVGMKLGYVIFTLNWRDFKLVKIAKEHTLSLSLATKDVYVIIEYTTSVTIATLGHGT